MLRKLIYIVQILSDLYKCSAKYQIKRSIIEWRNCVCIEDRIGWIINNGATLTGFSYSINLYILMNNVLAAYFTTLQCAQPNTRAFLHSSIRFSTSIKTPIRKRRVSIREIPLPQLPKITQINLDQLYDPDKDDFYLSCRSSRKNSPLLLSKTNYITQKIKEISEKKANNSKNLLSYNASKLRSISNNKIRNSNSNKLLHFIGHPHQWKFVVDGAKLQKTTNEFIIARNEEMMRTIRHPRWNVPGKEVVIRHLNR
jgi:hypothetical protein